MVVKERNDYGKINSCKKVCVSQQIYTNCVLRNNIHCRIGYSTCCLCDDGLNVVKMHNNGCSTVAQSLYSPSSSRNDHDRDRNQIPPTVIM